ncbi:sensor histidine kinase [Pilimelia columellifera]|uniref:histidine kinase n=1 Tax=Pilimelia columellifera subsp. columellifera TaxID=706583 RepID=A0ABN3NSR6_9ACTN
MYNGVLLAVIAGFAVLNGLFLDDVPLWRQLLFVVLAVVAYLHGRHLPTPREWLPLGAAGVVAAALVVVDRPAGVGATALLGVFVVLPWLAGRFRRQQAALVVAAGERVAELEQQQRFVAERAELRERARLAVDMHDALGHELALISLRAGALELDPEMTGANRAAAAALRAAAVAATDRLRHALGLLREPAPQGISVEALVHRAREAGMAVRLDRSGAGSAVAEEAAHRVVREALTNAARHAPGAEVEVRVARGDGRLTVAVRNPVAGTADPAGSGTGVAALRAHLVQLGGDLDASLADGAYLMTARLPDAPGHP